MFRRIIGSLMGATVLTLGTGSALGLTLVQFQKSLESVDHTIQVLETLSTTEVALFKAESDERAWVLSGSFSYLESYRTAADLVRTSLQSLHALVAENNSQMERFLELEQIIETRLVAFSKMAERGPDQKRDSLAILASERATEDALDVSNKLDIMKQSETTFLSARTRVAKAAAMRTTIVAAAMGFLATLGAFYAAFRMEQHRTLAELRSAKSDLEAVLTVIPDAIVTFEKDGTIKSFSTTAEQMFGLKAEETIAGNISSLFSGRALVALKSFVAQRDLARRSPPSQSTETYVQRRDGSSLPVDLRLSSIPLGRHNQLIAFIRDITALKARENQADKLRGELLHVSRLINMGEMASALAHELNQPLTALSAYLSGSIHLLERSDVPAYQEVIEALHSANSQALRAGDVIRRLREFVVRGETEKCAESLANMVEEALTLAMVVEKDSSIIVDVSLDSSVDLVLASKIQIEQVLLNLIRNGLEAMREMPRRRLLIGSQSGPGAMVTVSVADTGSGIPPEIADKLFESFITTKSDGLGVGLSLSRTIVEGHGGRIYADANPGGGSIFHFTLRAGTTTKLEPKERKVTRNRASENLLPER